MLPPAGSQRREMAMAIKPPTNDDLAEIAERYRLRLDPRDIESFRAVIAGALESYDAGGRLSTERLPEPPARLYRWPAETENKLGAWYVTTEIAGSGDG